MYIVSLYLASSEAGISNQIDFSLTEEILTHVNRTGALSRSRDREAGRLLCSIRRRFFLSFPPSFHAFCSCALPV